MTKSKVLQDFLSHISWGDAYMKKFADTSKDDYNAWYLMCREKNQPYIDVTPKRKYALIRWEDGQYAPETQMIIDNNAGEISEDIIKIIMKYSVKKVSIIFQH